MTAKKTGADKDEICAMYGDALSRHSESFCRLLARPSFWFCVSLFLLTAATLNKPMYWDEGLWSYIARLWVEDKIPPYTGAVENKTPGIFFLYYISHLLFGINIWFPRMVGILAISFTGFGIFSILKKVGNNNAGIIAAVLFYLVMPTKAVEGPFTAQTETFMIFFVVFSILALMHGESFVDYRRWFYKALAGFLMGCAIAFKQIAICETAFLFIMSICLTTNKGMKSKIATVGLVGLGIFAATVVSVIPLLLSGVSVRDYIDGAWLILLKPGSAMTVLPVRIHRFMRVFGDNRMIFLYIGLIGFMLKIKNFPNSSYKWFWLLWLLFAFVGANAAGTYFPHQLKQVIAPFCIVSGLFFDYLACIITYSQAYGFSKKYNFLIIIAVLTVLYIPFEKTYKCIPTQHTYLAMEQAVNLGFRVRELSGEQDFVFLWGNKNQIMGCSGRKSPSRYFNTLFLCIPGAIDELAKDISIAPPVIVVVDGRDRVPMPEWFKEKLKSEYASYGNTFNHKIFVLRQHLASGRKLIAQPNQYAGPTFKNDPAMKITP